MEYMGTYVLFHRANLPSIKISHQLLSIYSMPGTMMIHIIISFTSNNCLMWEIYY